MVLQLSPAWIVYEVEQLDTREVAVGEDVAEVAAAVLEAVYEAGEVNE